MKKLDVRSKNGVFYNGCLSQSSSGAEDTSHKRKAEKVSDFEKSAKRTRGKAISTLKVARYTKAPEKISSNLYDLVCSEKYKE